MKIRVFDVETTGMPPDARLCEVGWCDLFGWEADEDVGHAQWRIGEPIGMLLDPGIPMPPEARAIHHISDQDLVGAPSPDVGLLALGKGDPDVFVAHNAQFEQNFYTGGGKDWICTLKVARRLWPECPSHSNQCLRYWLGFGLDDELAMPPPSGRAGRLCNRAHSSTRAGRGDDRPDGSVDEGAVASSKRNLWNAPREAMVGAAMVLSGVDHRQIRPGRGHQIHRAPSP